MKIERGTLDLRLTLMEVRAMRFPITIEAVLMVVPNYVPGETGWFRPLFNVELGVNDGVIDGVVDGMTVGMIPIHYAPCWV